MGPVVQLPDRDRLRALPSRKRLGHLPAGGRANFDGTRGCEESLNMVEGGLQEGHECVPEEPPRRPQDGLNGVSNRPYTHPIMVNRLLLNALRTVVCLLRPRIADRLTRILALLIIRIGVCPALSQTVGE
eukprot:1563442-Pyramimonas_sp.AAC.2